MNGQDLATILERLDRIEHENKQLFDEVYFLLRGINTCLDGIDKKFEDVEEWFDRLETNMKGEFCTLKNRMDAMDNGEDWRR